MAMRGKRATQSGTGRTTEVPPFTLECEWLSKAPIVDATTKHDHPKTWESNMLTIKNGLHAPSMDYDLMLCFMLSEADVEGKPIPKTHTENPLPFTHLISKRKMLEWHCVCMTHFPILHLQTHHQVWQTNQRQENLILHSMLYRTHKTLFILKIKRT